MYISGGRFLHFGHFRAVGVVTPPVIVIANANMNMVGFEEDISKPYGTLRRIENTVNE
jgi:hypothetical protein